MPIIDITAQVRARQEQERLSQQAEQEAKEAPAKAWWGKNGTFIEAHVTTRLKQLTIGSTPTIEVDGHEVTFVTQTLLGELLNQPSTEVAPQIQYSWGCEVYVEGFETRFHSHVKHEEVRQGWGLVKPGELRRWDEKNFTVSVEFQILNTHSAKFTLTCPVVPQAPELRGDHVFQSLIVQLPNGEVLAQENNLTRHAFKGLWGDFDAEKLKLQGIDQEVKKLEAIINLETPKCELSMVGVTRYESSGALVVKGDVWHTGPPAQSVPYRVQVTALLFNFSTPTFSKSEKGIGVDDLKVEVNQKFDREQIRKKIESYVTGKIQNAGFQVNEYSQKLIDSLVEACIKAMPRVVIESQVLVVEEDPFQHNQTRAEQAYPGMGICPNGHDGKLRKVLLPEVAEFLGVKGELLENIPVQWGLGRVGMGSLLSLENFTDQRLVFASPLHPIGARFKAQVKTQNGKASATTVFSANVMRDVTRYTTGGPVTEPVIVGTKNAEHTFAVSLPAGFKGDLNGEYEIEVCDTHQRRGTECVYMVILPEVAADQDDYSVTESFVVGIETSGSRSFEQVWVISPKGKFIPHSRAEARGGRRGRPADRTRYHWDSAPAGCLVLTRRQSNYGYTHSVEFVVVRKPGIISKEQLSAVEVILQNTTNWKYFVGSQVRWDLSKVGSVTFTTEREAGRDDLEDFIRQISTAPVNPFDYEIKREAIPPDSELRSPAGVRFTVYPLKAGNQIPPTELSAPVGEAETEGVKFELMPSSPGWLRCSCGRAEMYWKKAEWKALEPESKHTVTCKGCRGVGEIQKPKEVKN